MSSISVAGHLQRREKVKDADRLVTVEHLRIKLYLKPSRHFGNLARSVVIVVLRAVRQAIPAVVHGWVMVCIGCLNDSHRLFRQIAPSPGVHIGRMMTACSHAR